MAAAAVKVNAVGWFEIPVKDLERARGFYEKVFDVKLTPEEVGGLKISTFPYEQEGTGAAGALIKGRSYEPSHAGTVIYFSVDSIDDVLIRINANGGKALMPKTSIGEHGFIAQFEDPEGNRLALHAMK